MVDPRIALTVAETLSFRVAASSINGRYFGS
jgi:hypothetical protein